MTKLGIAIILLASAAHAPAGALSAHGELIRDQSSIDYVLRHPLHSMDAKSTQANFRLDLDSTGTDVTYVAATVDVTTFDSGNSNRDSHAMEVIDAIDYPEAKFTSTKVVTRGDSLDVSGKLDFHGITKDIVVHAASHRKGDTLEFDGGFNVSLTDFKIERPSLLMIPVEDTLHFALKAVFKVARP